MIDTISMYQDMTTIIEKYDWQPTKPPNNSDMSTAKKQMTNGLPDDNAY
jgi:hypothetical protein